MDGFLQRRYLRLDIVALFPRLIGASLSRDGPALLLLLLPRHVRTLLLRDVAALLLGGGSALLSRHIGTLLPGNSLALLPGNLLVDGLALPAGDGPALLGLHLLGNAGALLLGNL